MMIARPTRKPGFTLVEVVGALALIAVISALAVSNVRLASLGNYSAATEAQQIVMDLRNARRRAIATGDNHLLTTTNSGWQVLGYSVDRRNGSVLDPYTEYRPVKKDVTVYFIPRRPSVEFTFEGDALRSYTIYVAGREERWLITVSQAGGGIAIRKL